MAFSPDGLGVLSGENGLVRKRNSAGQESTHFSARRFALRMWAVASGRNVFTMRGAGGVVKALDLSSNGRYAAACDPDVARFPVLIWDLKTGTCIHRLLQHDKTKRMRCTQIAFSPSDRRVMAALENGTVLVWDLATEQEQPPITLMAGPIKPGEFLRAAFTSERQRLITGRRTGPVELWDLQTGQRMQTFAGHWGAVRGVAGSADGPLILSCAERQYRPLMECGHRERTQAIEER